MYSCPYEIIPWRNYSITALVYIIVNPNDKGNKYKYSLMSLNYQCLNGAHPYRKCSIKTPVKCRTFVYVKQGISLLSWWLGIFGQQLIPSDLMMTSCHWSWDVTVLCSVDRAPTPKHIFRPHSWSFPFPPCAIRSPHTTSRTGKIVQQNF